MYKTELMEQILKSKKGQELVQMMTPRYGDAYVALWILEAIGQILDEMAEWSETLEDQTRPQTATWSLPLWEKQYSTVPDPSWDIERRRQNITNKMQQRAPMNPEKLAALIAVVSGATVKILENTGKNRFTVVFSGIQSLENEDVIRATINRAKQAHLIYDFLIEEIITCDVKTYTGIGMTEYVYEKIEVRQLK